MWPITGQGSGWGGIKGESAGTVAAAVRQDRCTVMCGRMAGNPVATPREAGAWGRRREEAPGGESMRAE